ncbi:MAG: TOBE domain-containing protein, partial [Nakamurella sp.]
NHLTVAVTELEPRGELLRVHAADITGGTGVLLADITAASAADLELMPGKHVHFAVKATEVQIYPIRQL